MAFGEVNPQLLRLWLFVESSKEYVQKSRGNTSVWRFLRGIWFHTHEKDGANTSNIWSPQRNCYLYNNALQKHESNGSLTQWWYWFLWRWAGSFAKRHINTISINNLPRLRTLKVNRSNERWFHSKKKKKKKKTTSRRYSADTITGADYTNDLAFLANTLSPVESQLHDLEQVARGIGLYVYSDKTEFMCI